MKVLPLALLMLAVWSIALPGLAHTANESAVSLIDQTWHEIKRWFTPTVSIVSDSSEIFDNDEKLREYVQHFGLAETINQLDMLAMKRGNCHQVAHKAGRFAFEIFGVEVFRVHTTKCHAGGMHGAAESFFRHYGTQDLGYLLNTVCFQYASRQAIGECLHGVGHGLMAWTNYELLDALKYCDWLTDAAWSPACYGGVFMENVLGGLAEETGHVSRYVSQTDFHYPCTIVDDRYKTMCYYHQPSRLMFIMPRDWPAIIDVCEEAPLFVRSACYQGIGKELPWQFNYAPASMVAVCSLARSPASARACWYEAIKSMFADTVDNEPITRQMCALLPAPQRADCDQFVTTWRTFLTSESSQASATATFWPSFPPPALRLRSLPKSGTAISINLYDDRSDPPAVTVRRGQTITFINSGRQPKWPATNIHPTHRGYPESDIELCAMPQARRMFDACHPLATGETYSFQFNYPGIWRWHDHLNPVMTGVLTVE